MCMREYKKMKTYKVMKIIKASENILVIQGANCSTDETTNYKTWS